MSSVIFTRFVRYFDEVVRSGSIRLASERLNVAPSAIDRQILNAEEELGIPLFERSPQGMRPTAAAEQLIHHIRRWQREFGAVAADIEGLRGLHGGRVSLAVVEAVSEAPTVEVIRDLHRRYPRVTFEVTVAGSSAVRELVLSGEADVGVTFNSAPTRALRVERSMTFHFGVVVPADHPLAGRRTIRLSECAEWPMILPSAALSLRAVVDRAVAMAGVDIRAASVANSIVMIKSLVLQKVGIGFLTELDVMAEVAEGRMRFLRLTDSAVPPSVLSVITPPQLPLGAAQLARAWVTRIAAIEGIVAANRGERIFRTLHPQNTYGNAGVGAEP